MPPIWQARDALVKHVYECVFRWVVTRVNEASAIPAIHPWLHP